jgi:hypothetical protein
MLGFFLFAAKCLSENGATFRKSAESADHEGHHADVGRAAGSKCASATCVRRQGASVVPLFA